MNSVLKRQVKGYLISGFLATGSDFIVYNILLHFIEYNISKAISFLVGTIVAYLYNKYITFATPRRSFYETFKFFLVYTVSMLCNVSINHVGLQFFKGILSLRYALISAFILATMITMIINFLGQKFWVFKK